MSGTKPEPPEPAPTPEAEIRAVLERARSGDATALPRLRGILDVHPEIWEHYGALAVHARQAWVDLVGATDLAMKESLARQVVAMKAELAGPSPSPLERLLVDRIATCWLQICYADAAATRAEGLSRKQTLLAVKRQDSAHRRYITAIGTLAMTRRLLAAAEEPSRRGDRAVSGRPAGDLIVGPADPEPVVRKSKARDRGDDELVMAFVPAGKKPSVKKAARPRKTANTPDS